MDHRYLGIIGSVLRILAALTLLGIAGLALIGTLEDQPDSGASSIVVGIIHLVIGVLWLIVARCHFCVISRTERLDHSGCRGRVESIGLLPAW